MYLSRNVERETNIYIKLSLYLYKEIEHTIHKMSHPPHSSTDDSTTKQQQQQSEPPAADSPHETNTEEKHELTAEELYNNVNDAAIGIIQAAQSKFEAAAQFIQEKIHGKPDN